MNGHLRRFGPTAIVLGLIASLALMTGAQSDPGTGVQVPTLAEHNTLESRVTTLEDDVAELKARPTPTVTVTPTPTPTPTPDPEPEWPEASNTGVPAGTTLTPYAGTLTITAADTVIRDRIITGNLRIRAPRVQIINTRINGRIELRFPQGEDAGNSYTITDSEVHVGDVMATGLMRGNFTATRVEVTGGNRSIYCEFNCTIEDSWVHAQATDEGGATHFSGVRMSQNLTLRHNTVTCEAGRGPGTGCSAALTGYGDFAPVQNNLVEGNRFIGHLGGGATLCVYGGSAGDDGSKPFGHLAADIRFVDNVFVRGTSGVCGNLGAVGSFDPARPGNVWSGNTWDDGTPIRHTD